MPQSIIQARLIVKNDSSENWSERNPVLLAGEPGYSSDKKILKFGDGVTNWNELPSISVENLTIPIATEEIVGGVLSSQKDNEIKVKEDGTMSLNKVSSSLLYVPEDDELILNGGKS